MMVIFLLSVIAMPEKHKEEKREPILLCSLLGQCHGDGERCKSTIKSNWYYLSALHVSQIRPDEKHLLFQVSLAARCKEFLENML